MKIVFIFLFNSFAYLADSQEALKLFINYSIINQYIPNNGALANEYIKNRIACPFISWNDSKHKINLYFHTGIVIDRYSDKPEPINPANINPYSIVNTKYTDYYVDMALGLNVLIYKREKVRIDCNGGVGGMTTFYYTDKMTLGNGNSALSGESAFGDYSLIYPFICPNYAYTFNRNWTLNLNTRIQFNTDLESETVLHVLPGAGLGFTIMPTGN